MLAKMKFTLEEFYSLFEKDKYYDFDAYETTVTQGDVPGAYFRINGKTFLVAENIRNERQNKSVCVLNTYHSFKGVFEPEKVKVEMDDTIIKFLNKRNTLILRFGIDNFLGYRGFACNFYPGRIGEEPRKPDSIDSELLV